MMFIQVGARRRPSETIASSLPVVPLPCRFISMDLAQATVRYNIFNTWRN
jgi:hypothetical protein